MVEPLGILLQISILLLGGTILSLLAAKLRLPEVLLFILLGFGLQWFSDNIHPFLDLPFVFIATTGLLVLALKVFEGSSHISFRTLDRASSSVLSLVGANTLLHLLVFTAAVMFIMDLTLPLAALFATIFLGTSAPITLGLLGDVKGYVFDLLRFESLLNTPINAVLPFLVMDWFFQAAAASQNPARAFLLQIVVGVGVGVLTGLILFKILRGLYSRIYSPLAVLIASLLTYAVAETLDGSGVLAVMALGLLFGNMYIKEKAQILEVEGVFSRSVYILLLVLFGTLVSFPLTLAFLLKVVVLLVIYTGIRFASVILTVRDVPPKQQVFMALLGTNGVTSISIMVVLASLQVAGVAAVLELFGAFLTAQLILSSVAAAVSGLFVEAPHDTGHVRA